MLMAGVLNSEVEKFCPASYRGAPPVQSPGHNSRRSPTTSGPSRQYGAPSVMKTEKPSQRPLARSGKRV